MGTLKQGTQARSINIMGNSYQVPYFPIMFLLHSWGAGLGSPLVPLPYELKGSPKRAPKF